MVEKFKMKVMKKFSTIILLAFLLGGIFSCKNDSWSFPDFDYTTTYFPYQFPVRTLVLGDYNFDNSNDNSLKFKITMRVGGMYQNNSNWTVDYKLEPSLVDKLITAPNTFDGKTASTSDTLKLLPSAYYTLSPANQVVIPKGSFMGSVDVQLTEAFLNDTFAAKTRYVIPLKITASTSDSILKGKSQIDNPDPRIASNWIIMPKDYTIFGIKFVNAYHGMYLHRGTSVITDTVQSSVLETIVVRQKYVEKDELWKLQTTSRNTVKIDNNVLRKSTGSPGKYNMKLIFDSSNNCVVRTGVNSAFKVSGTGKFVKNGDMWGNVQRDAIYLDYAVTQGPNKYAIKDTLVFRDKAVTYLEYAPVVLP
jgi:hypothetical protein